MKRTYSLLTLSNDKITEKEKHEVAGAEKNKLFPTDIGQVVNSFLMEHFSEIMDYNFTAKVEREFDEVAEGQKQWSLVIKNFYWPFHEKVEQTLKESEKYSGQRLLGKDPASGRNVYAKIGRFGSMIQIGDPEETDKPRFASLRKEQTIDTITLDESLELFKLPRKAGEFENKELVIGVGRFGPYIRHDGKFYSLPKEEDPLTVTTEKSIEVIEEKRESDRKKTIQTFDEEPDIRVLKGKWGPYIASGKKNYKIPKDLNPEQLTLEEIKKIISDGTSEAKSRKTKKTSSSKKRK